MMGKNPRPVGLYLHVPFCHARCGYCDFVTFAGQEDKIDEYVRDFCREIKMYGSCNAVTPTKVGAQSPNVLSPGLRRDDVNDGTAKAETSISTVFFGGGTPSLLGPRHVSQILNAVRSHFDLSPDAEVTLEANPESITLEKARAWKNAGITRLSVGLQVFDNALLKKIDRLHTVEEFMEAYHSVRQAGFDNVSIDLIYGFDGQTLDSWKETLKSTVALNPEHLSLYALKIEEHTPFASRDLRINDDLEAEMYEWARRSLAAEGYQHYEISNFARPGRACRHNLIYWRQQDYLGVGVGAVGCVEGLRWENHKNLHDYHRDIAAGALPRVLTENLDQNTRRFERLMLGLRLREGLFWDDTNPEWLKQRSALTARGLLEEIDPGRWRIPDSAVSLTNQILLPFL